MKALASLLLRTPKCTFANSSQLVCVRNRIQTQVRTLRLSPCLYNDEETRHSMQNDDDEVEQLHKSFGGTKISFKEERKPWVGYNPFKESMPSDWLSFLSRRTDWETFFEDKWESHTLAKLRYMQEFVAERKKVLGGELALARFVVAMGGKVQLRGDEHIYCRDTIRLKQLPTAQTVGLFVEAVDLSNTQLIYEGIPNLFQSKTLVHLSLSNCVRLDEWAISRLAMIPSLVSLDLSNNAYITERSLIPLHHIPNLQRLNLRGIKYFKDVPLPLIFLENLLPNCVITADSET